MFSLRLIWLILVGIGALPAVVWAQEKPVVLTHYMPWFNSKQVSGDWGWHWKLKNRNPEKVIDGKREIASHYYPLMDPYDSSDPDALDCHVLLMKIAGIDGVIIDWYGIEEHWDYGVNHKNTLAMIKAIKKAGLKYAICYEDQTVGHLINAEKVKGDDGITHASDVIRYLANNCFSDANYVRLDGRPVLLVFGPQFFSGRQLKEICEDVKPSPLLYALPHLAANSGADGAFGWPPVTGGKEIAPKQWNEYLDRLYQSEVDARPAIGTVFPQFHDYYQEGEGRPSFGSISSQGKETFKTTIRRAWDSKSEIIQIATWNDYGEGTMIEPTREFGYQFLELIQNQIFANDSAKLKNSRSALELPIRLYKLQKAKTGQQSRAAKLDDVSELLFQGNYTSAKEELDRLESSN